MSEEILLIDKRLGKLELTVEKGEKDAVFLTMVNKLLNTQATMFLNDADINAMITALTKLVKVENETCNQCCVCLHKEDTYEYTLLDKQFPHMACNECLMFINNNDEHQQAWEFKYNCKNE